MRCVALSLKCKCLPTYQMLSCPAHVVNNLVTCWYRERKAEKKLKKYIHVPCLVCGVCGVCEREVLEHVCMAEQANKTGRSRIVRDLRRYIYTLA